MLKQPEDASFLGQNFRHLRKISSFLSDIVLPDKVIFSSGDVLTSPSITQNTPLYNVNAYDNYVRHTNSTRALRSLSLPTWHTQPVTSKSFSFNL